MKNITVLGWYNKKNIGDESYKLAFPLLFPDFSFKYTDILTKKTIEESDIFILGGGAVFDNFFLNQLKNIKKQKYCISVSVSPNIIKGQEFNSILVRDFRSKKILNNLGYECQYIPDVSFILEANLFNGKKWIEKIKQEIIWKNKTVVVVVNSYLMVTGTAKNQNAFSHFSNMLAEVIDSIDANFIFIPFGQNCPWDDRISNGIVASKCSVYSKNFIIYEELGVQKTLDIISAADAVISTRLHSTLFSCNAGTPFIDVTHHDKNLGFLETINKTDCSIPFWFFDVKKCIKLLNSILETNLKESELAKEQKNLLRGNNVCVL